MSAIEDLERRNETRFDEQTFVDFLDSLEPGFGWESGRWELIDGLPIEMPPATRRHGFIAQNLERLLAAALSTAHPHLDAIREAGIRFENDPMFRPVADVIVFDVEKEASDGNDRFYETCRLIGEVMSTSTRQYDLLQKRRRYTELPDCLHVLFIEQGRLYARHWARSQGWAEAVYERPDDLIDLPEFGFACHLKDLYARTDLA